VTLEPAAQAVQPRKENPLIDIHLVKFVTDLPFQGSRNDYLAGDPQK